MEGGDLRASIQRARLRPLSLFAVTATLVGSLVLATPLPAGAGTVHAPVHVPRLIGLTKARVFALMRGAGLYFVTRGPGSATNSWVGVVAQSPAPGALVAWHSQVIVTTTLQSPTGPRPVPRLVGLTQPQVFAAMKKAELYFRTIGPGSTNGRWVVALHQSPPAGTRVPWHSMVIVSVSTVRPKPKPKPVVKHKITVKKPPVTTTTSSTTTTTTTPIPTTTYPGETTTTTLAPPPTTTTTLRPTTTTTIKKVKARYRIGIATWYSYIPGHCATWFLPMGTHLTVRDLATGKTIHCVVTDREAAHGNRVVDLSETQFSQFAPLARGVVTVRVSW